MNYIINLTASNFSRQLDDVSALNLASVSGLFASFKNQNNIQIQNKQYVVFNLINFFHGNPSFSILSIEDDA